MRVYTFEFDGAMSRVQMRRGPKAAGRLQPSHALAGMMFACFLAPTMPSLAAIDSFTSSELVGAATGGSSHRSCSSGMLRLRGGHPAENTGATLAAFPLGDLLGRVGQLPSSRAVRSSVDMDDFDIDTLQPACLPPLRPRLTRRHGRAASGAAKGDTKKSALKKPCAHSAKSLPAGSALNTTKRTASKAAVEAAEAAAAAAQIEAWEDAISHVSASAGVASHISALPEAYYYPTIFGAPAATAESAGHVRDISHVSDVPHVPVRDMRGLLDDSQMAETTEDYEVPAHAQHAHVHACDAPHSATKRTASKASKTPAFADSQSQGNNKGVSVGDVLNGRYSLLGLLGAGFYFSDLSQFFS